MASLSISKDPLSRAEKIPRTDANYRVTDGNIAAIDFGTTSVSLAYFTKGDEQVNTLILDPEIQAARVPNAVLFQRDGYQTIVSNFGGTARSRFIAMKAGDHTNHIYFERIKMLMKRDKTINRESLVESFSGEVFFLVEVVAFILQYLKDQLIDHLSRTAKPLKTTDFDWVITVPAIWDARGKRMMREAAYLAGLLTESSGINKFTAAYTYTSLSIPNETNPERLSLALEPEAAALYSQEMVGQEIEGAGDKAAISRPTEYMVIDIGGGTVDITAHEEVPGGGIRVQNVPTGNAWGGTQVNDAFSKLLQKLVSDPDFKRFLTSSSGKSQKYTQNMAALNKILYKEFEEQKLVFGQCKHETIAISLPSKFTKFYEDELIDGAEDMYGVEYDDDLDTLYLEKHVIESQLLGPAIEGIIECTLKAIEDNGCKVNTFYLVGGFGGCKYVHQKVSAAIEKLYNTKGRQCDVVVPRSPALAVATGAAMWRKNPNEVKARRVDATYGIGVSIPFNPDMHNLHYRYYDEEDKKYRCNNVFSVFLLKGELANANEVITTDVVPRRNQTRMTIGILSTTNLGVQYIEDKNGRPTVTKIGQIVLDLPNPDDLPIEKRGVDVTMDFSGTEIQAKAKYHVTGKEVKTVCDFLSAN